MLTAAPLPISADDLAVHADGHDLASCRPGELGQPR